MVNNYIPDVQSNWCFSHCPSLLNNAEISLNIVRKSCPATDITTPRLSSVSPLPWIYPYYCVIKHWSKSHIIH